eukprot:snap_masked-scaffold_34-processed-gene-0.51-mRNA-1 protein AED:0.32 eAED:0.32 QI:0/-1/0/1/-1/1/1/0/203
MAIIDISNCTHEGNCLCREVNSKVNGFKVFQDIQQEILSFNPKIHSDSEENEFQRTVDLVNLLESSCEIKEKEPKPVIRKKRKHKLCSTKDCKKLAQGKTGKCFGCGGGYKCMHPGCKKSARGTTGACILHGGGYKCSVPGCKSAARGKARLCIFHGGGKRCVFEGCTKSAQGKTNYCKRHFNEIKESGAKQHVNPKKLRAIK